MTQHQELGRLDFSPQIQMSTKFIYKLHTLMVILMQVFLEYADVDGSSKARSGMNGRKFGGNQVVAVYYPEDKYAQGDYED